MREPILRFDSLDRFGHHFPLGGLWAAPIADQRFDTRSFFDVTESENTDEWEHLWLELGGEG